MKKLSFILLFLPLFASGQPIPKTQTIEGIIRCTKRCSIEAKRDSMVKEEWYRQINGQGNILLLLGPTLPPLTVRIHVDDDDPVQTIIDALKKAGVIVERTEWNYEKKYSEYKIIKQLHEK